MIKTRFENQAISTRATAQPRNLLAGFLFGAVFGAAGCVDTRIATGNGKIDQSSSHLTSPRDAVTPKGLDMVKVGMSPEQVVAILGPVQDLKMDMSILDKNRMVHFFIYPGKTEMLIAHIFYRQGKVFEIFFGYPAASE